MSKTNRTDPYWVRAKNNASSTEVSHSCVEFTLDHDRRWMRYAPTEHCDVDTGPKTLCCRYFTSNIHDMPTSAPSWFIDHLWTSLDRTRARDECRDAMRDYNAYGETDLIPTTDNHRHDAMWRWY